jgi:hypothetical protein
MTRIAAARTAKVAGPWAWVLRMTRDPSFFAAASRATAALRRLAIPLVSVTLVVAPACAEESAATPRPLSDPFQLTLASFFVTTQPTIRLDSGTGEGDRVQWEREFGDLESWRARLEAHWRFAERHKLEATVFGASRERGATIDRDIHWGGQTYPADAHVDADFDFSIAELAYAYAFLRRDGFEVLASVGFHYTKLEASLEARAEESGGLLEVDLFETANLDAPLPLIGVGGLWSLPRDFWLDASARFFYLTAGDYEGNLQRYQAALTWQPRAWLGIGIGYSHFTIDLQVASSDLDGAIDWVYRGPMVFYRASF